MTPCGEDEEVISQPPVLDALTVFFLQFNWAIQWILSNLTLKLFFLHYFGHIMRQSWNSIEGSLMTGLVEGM